MTTYTPKPLNTAAVALPPSLAALLEKLAENTHEVCSNATYTYICRRNRTNACNLRTKHRRSRYRCGFGRNTCTAGYRVCLPLG